MLLSNNKVAPPFVINVAQIGTNSKKEAKINKETAPINHITS
jgi:hypothetical protein